MSATARRAEDLTAEELAVYSDEHIRYEIEMFVWAARQCREFQAGYLLNALIEAAVLHYRNLIEFFVPTDIHDDDVVAKLYLMEAMSMKKIHGPLKAARRRANKELAHLTLDRKAGTPRDKDWNFEAISNE